MLLSLASLWVLFLGISPVWAAVAASPLDREIAREVATPQAMSASEVRKLQGTQFIFIDGIFGDSLQANFFPALGVARDEWHDEDAVIWRPDTSKPVSENAAALVAKLRQLREGSHRADSVIVAHSKGAAETALMFARHPDLITELGVRAILAVSAPFAGTRLMNWASVGCPKARFVCRKLNDEVPAMASLSPEAMVPAFQSALAKLSPAQLALLNQTLFFAETEMSDQDYASVLWPSHYYLARIAQASGALDEVANDGVIPTVNERLVYGDQVIGHDLGPVTGDHNSVFAETKNAKTLVYRQAFFRVLIRQAY